MNLHNIGYDKFYQFLALLETSGTAQNFVRDNVISILDQSFDQEMCQLSCSLRLFDYMLVIVNKSTRKPLHPILILQLWLSVTCRGS